MTRFFRLFILTMVFAAMHACTAEETSLNDGYGRLEFRMSGIYDANLPVSLSLSTDDDAYSHVWSDINDFPVYENFRAGNYHVVCVQGVPGSEGYDCPCFIADADITVLSGATTTVDMQMRPTQAIVTLDVDDKGGDYLINAIELHTPGNSYVKADLSSHAALYLSPGETAVFVTVSDMQGKEITFALSENILTEAGEHYHLVITLVDDNKLRLVCRDMIKERVIEPALFDSTPPIVVCHGFEENIPLSITEGLSPSERIIMEVSAIAGIKSLTLTAITDFPLPDDIPNEADVLPMRDQLQEYGLSVDLEGPGTALLDFTGLLENISVNRDTGISFILQACDVLGRVSEAAVLKVDINRVSLLNPVVSDALLGENIASVTFDVNVQKVELSDFRVYVDGCPNPVDFKCDYDADKRKVSLSFTVPEGVDRVPVGIDYLGQRRLEVEVGRSVPEFTVHADAFATYALIRVHAPTDALASAITRYIELSDKGKLHIFNRRPEEFMFVVSVLSPAQTYNLDFTVIGPDPEASVRFTTESTPQVPDGDFEDGAPAFSYSDLPSGGAYSASTFSIFNMQNYADIDVWWPKKYWASINAKTFSMAAHRHNTWYMQPSAWLDFSESVSGSKSMRIQSVGWSLDGAAILPSVQENDVYVPYNTNIPECDNISAGRLFLGSYSFNPGAMSERYSQGVQFSSRPSSLNGFYKYIPDEVDSSDRGTVSIELVNDAGEAEILIASAKMLLNPSPDFKSFNLPLDYFCYNIKPTRLRIMFSSSSAAGVPGDSDSDVPVTAIPETAVFRGSILWVDNLSFSY